MLKRLELHNHTTESDAGITVKELIELMVDDKVDAVALTDHNTVSGHYKAKALLSENQYPIECIYGMEYTTYYGHILCLNLETYVPWENINLHKPELLFHAAKQAGALAGIAHPYSYGAPFARGCHFDMTVTDYSEVDFIEIFNNPEPLHEVNEPALLLWESLVLKGEHLAMTSGMDLHGRMDMRGHYATYIDCGESESIAAALDRAVRTQRTFITKGPVFDATVTEQNGVDGILCFLHPVCKPGYTQKMPFLVQCKSAKGEQIFMFPQPDAHDGDLFIPFELIGNPDIIIMKLFELDQNSLSQSIARIENLVAIAPVLYR